MENRLRLCDGGVVYRSDKELTKHVELIKKRMKKCSLTNITSFFNHRSCRGRTSKSFLTIFRQSYHIDTKQFQPTNVCHYFVAHTCLHCYLYGWQTTTTNLSLTIGSDDGKIWGKFLQQRLHEIFFAYSNGNSDRWRGGGS